MNYLINKKVILVLIFVSTILALILISAILSAQEDCVYADVKGIDKSDLIMGRTPDLGDKSIPNVLTEDNILDFVDRKDFLIEQGTSKIYNGKQYSYYVRRTVNGISFYFFKIEYNFFNDGFDHSVDFKCINAVTFSYIDLKDQIIIERVFSNKLVLANLELVETIEDADLKENNDRFFIQTRYSSESISRLKTSSDVLSGMSYVLSIDSLMLAWSPVGNCLSVASLFSGAFAEGVGKSAGASIIVDTAKDYPITKELQRTQYGKIIKSLEVCPFEGSNGFYLSKGDNIKCIFKTLSNENVNNIYISNFKLTFGSESNGSIYNEEDIELKSSYTINNFTDSSAYVLQGETVVSDIHTYLIPNTSEFFYEYIPKEDGYYSFDDYISVQNVEKKIIRILFE